MTGAIRRHSLYVVAAFVPRRDSVEVGSLGTVAVGRGWYAYVGSARRGRGARVARHLRAAKQRHWHADYLFSQYPATLAWTVDGILDECESADALAQKATVAWAARRGGVSLSRGRAAATAGAAVGWVPASPEARRRPEQTEVPQVRPWRFGSSDCGCVGHLVRFPSRRSLWSALSELAAGNGLAVKAVERCLTGPPLGQTASASVKGSAGRDSGTGVT